MVGAPFYDGWLAWWTSERVTAAAVLLTALAILFARKQLRESERARNAQVTMDLSRRWNEGDLRGVRQELREIGGRNELATEMKALRDKIKDRESGQRYRRLLSEPDYLEDLAVMIRHKALDFEIVKDSLGYIVCYRWNLWEPTVEFIRAARHEPTCFEHFENLAKRMRTGLRIPTDWDGFKD